MHFSADGTYKTNAKDLVLWRLGAQRLLTCRQDVWVTTQFVVAVLARAEDGGAIKVGTRMGTCQETRVSVESVMTDITVDGGPSGTTLQDAWPGVRAWRDVQLVRIHAKESRLKTAADVKGYTSHLVGSMAALPSLVEFSAPREF